MSNVFAYLRVSGKTQVDGDGFDRQEQAIRGYCGDMFPICGFFQEKGVSGTVEGVDRPMLSDILNKLARPGDAIVVERLDRLARDLMVQELFLKECRERKVKVFAADQSEYVDLASNEVDPTRKLIRQVMGALAEWEKSVLVKKLRDAKARMRQEGTLHEGNKPFGHNAEEQNVLKLIGNLRASGLTFERIAEMLNESGFKARYGKTWTRQLANNAFVAFKRQQPEGGELPK